MISSLKRKQSGFTIIELLIVIIVIGILALLVITTFSGVQQRARNTERETDVKAIHGQIEAYYSNEDKYPTLANLQDDAWVQSNLKGLDTAALTAPRATGNNIVGTGAAEGNYQYAPTPDGCTNTEAAPGDCTGYTLTATLEGGGTFVKNDLAGN